MFGIGMPEMLLILAVALIVIGPKKLPDLAKSLGRGLAEFRKATSEIKESLELDDTELKDIKTTFDDMRNEVKEAVDIKIDFESKEQEASATDEKENDNRPETKKQKAH